MNRSKKIRREAEDIVQAITSDYQNDPSQSFFLPFENEPVYIPSNETDVHNTSFSSISSSLLDQNTEQYSKETISTDIRQKLSEWAVRNLISHNALKELLNILSTHIPNLSKDPRTLKNTPHEVLTTPLDNGEYVHYGLRDGLTDFLVQNNQESTNIVLDFNIDGLPVAKSSRKQVWPILCNIVGTQYVFLIGTYAGTSKPNNSDDYLLPFITEIKEVLTEGITCNNQNYSISLRAFICDAPARSFVLKTKGHTGYNCCIKCTQKGSLVGKKVVFPFENCAPRTDQSFRSRNNVNHHHQLEPIILESLPIDCVVQFPFDYMHVVCLGVTKTLISAWIKSKGNKYSLPSWKISSFNKQLEHLKSQIPFEFNRNPRNLCDLDRWKATEFRQFLLYTGPLILKNILNEEMYQHFLKLSLAMRILLHKRDCFENNACANELLVSFVKFVPHFYGEQFLTFNFHCLTHIANDAKFYGSLENFSAFKYENYLHHLKKAVKKGNFVCSQIYNRLVEKSVCNTKLNSEVYPVLEKYNGTSYETVSIVEFKFSIHSPNCYYLTRDFKVYKINAIQKEKNEVIFHSSKIKGLIPFFENPINSDKFYIFRSTCFELSVEKITEKHDLKNILTKMIVLYNPETSTIFLAPLIHF